MGGVMMLHKSSFVKWYLFITHVRWNSLNVFVTIVCTHEHIVLVDVCCYIRHIIMFFIENMVLIPHDFIADYDNIWIKYTKHL